MFASNTDIQSWLQNDKISVDDALAGKPNIDAARTIKGQLAGVFSPITISSWADPASTPEVIRGIAGRLAAAFIYRKIYSEETGEIPAYAQELYNEDIGMLVDIKTGNLTVTDNSDEPVDVTGGNLLSFWPNDSTPAFTMDQEFA
jgi:hypothetical protein